MKYGGIFKKILLLLLPLILLLMTISAYKINSVGAINTNRTSEVVTNKIDKKVEDTFEKASFVTYVIKMKEQLDIQEAQKNAEMMSAIQKESMAKQKETVRNHVIQSLQEVSEQSQNSLIDFLKEKKTIKEVKSYHSFYIVNAIEVTSNKKVMKEIARRQDVEKITPNRTYKLNKTKIEKQKLDKSGQANGVIPWNLKNMNVPQVWKEGVDGNGVTVAIIDSGVDHMHPALSEQWRGYKPDGSMDKPEYHWLDATLENTKLPSDFNGHGTHVAGSILGQEPDGTNKIGVAPRAKWIAAKVFNKAGEATDTGIIRAGEWIIAPGGLADLAPDIINNSWSLSVAGKNEYIRDIVKAWRAANILPVFSAGNVKLPQNEGGKGSVPAPANYPESFTVGAVDEANRLADFSLLGPSPYDKTKPEVSAPGVGIRSSIPEGKYAFMNGTSMASPHVAGVAALLLQANQSLKVDELEQILMDTSVPLTDRKFPQTPNNGYGYGMVNALNAIKSINTGLGEVSGKVTVDGIDEEVPTIYHMPITIAFNVLDQEIFARVKDDIGITKVALEMRLKGEKDWETFDMDIISGDRLDGEYEGEIPVGKLQLPEVEYRIRAVDYGDNETITDIYTVEVSEGVKVGYKQSFEENIDGFDFDGDDIWEWGVPRTGPEKAYTGEKVIATNLSGTYQEGSEGFFVLPLIDLRDVNRQTVLSFAHWYKFGNWMMANFDTAEIYVGTKSESENKFDFELVKLYDYSQREWKKDYIDLTPYLGQQIYIIFNLHGNYGSDLGWYIDDIEIMEPDTFIPDTPELKVRSNTPGRVIVEWETSEEDQIMDYVIYRSRDPDKGFQEIATTKEQSYGDLPEIQKGTYYYYVRSRTYGYELSEASNIISWTFTGGEEIFSDDFESEDKEWIVGEESDWEKGIPSGSKGPKKAISGNNVWGTNLSGKYNGNVSHVLTSPIIDLTQSKHASIYFQHWYEIDNYLGEYGYVEISKDNGETWKQITRYPKDVFDKNHQRMFWYLDELNIDEYVGEKIQVRFRLESKDKWNFDAGWYLDDFEIRDTPAVKSMMSSKEEENDEGTVTKNEEENIKPATEEKQQESTDYHLTVEAPTWSEVIQARKYSQISREGIVNTKKSTLPASAYVSIEETDRSTKTAIGTGKFRMKHPVGSYTMKVEAYGYKTKEKKINIKENESFHTNIHLEPLLKGKVQGKIVDEWTGKPVENAHVKVIGDTNVKPVQTSNDGNYALDLYEGTYYLVVSAKGFLTYKEVIEVKGDDNLYVKVKLSVYEHGEDVEISYDTGSAENGVATYSSNSAYAVKMTTDNLAQIMNAKFLFWDEGWPNPGGEDFQYAIYAADGMEGQPGTLLAGPYDGKAKTDGSWTEVDIADPIIVDGDFYVVYIQTGEFPNVPGLAIDTDGEFSNRSWKREGTIWKKEKKSTAPKRNYMIRSMVRPIIGEKELKIIDLAVKPENLRLKEEEQQLLQVKGVVKTNEDERGIVPIVGRVGFESTDERVVRVDSVGNIIAIAEGKAEVIVTYKDLVKHIPVEVEKKDTSINPKPEKPDPKKSKLEDRKSEKLNHKKTKQGQTKSNKSKPDKWKSEGGN